MIAAEKDLVSPYMPLQELHSRLKQLEESKVDFVADSRNLVVGLDESRGFVLKPADAQTNEFLPSAGFALRRHALGQLLSRVSPNIPTKFFDRLTEELPEKAVELINDCKNHSQKKFFVRCIDDEIRAVMSDSYRVIDNLDICMSALNSVREGGGRVLKASLSESQMRISFTTTDIVEHLTFEERTHGRGSHKFIHDTDLRHLDPNDGDEFSKAHPVVTISNSETGQGGTSVWYGVFRSWCVNTSLMKQDQRRVHIGSKLDEGLYSDETHEKHTAAIMSALDDSIKGGLKPDVFAELIGKAKQAADTPIANTVTAVKNIVKQCELSEKQEDDLLKHFCSDYDSNVYGLGQAISRAAQDMEDADQVDEFEKLSGRVLNGEFNQLVAV